MTPPRWLVPRAAYVHVPFCAHHCGYCDFAVVSGRDEPIGPYLDALAAELATLGTPRTVETIFLGGGTPSYLAARELGRLVEMTALWLPLAPGGEYTVEANPESLTIEKVELLAEAGVNRVSLGAQSFRPEVLRVLERAHDPAEVAHAVGRARERMPQVSLDLIFGVPGQSVADWRGDLERALALGVDHLSTYGLTYEKGTPLWKQRRAGRLVPPGEDDELAMYALAIDRLGEAGMDHYEISNFARPGCRSRHNQVYWANEAYFGFGLGAARYVGGRREVNTRDLGAYIRRVTNGQPATQHGEALDAAERARETMAVQLRRCEGIDREAFLAQTGHALDEVAGAALVALLEQGLLCDDGARVALTRRGKYVADAVIARLLR